jgi:hypothetical protein
MAHEDAEQIELAARELEVAARAQRAVAGQVELELADLDRVVALRRPAAQEGVQPGNDLLERERLDHVVVGARLQPRHAVADLVAGRQYAYRQVVAGAAQAPQHLQAVEVGHRHVEQHHGRLDLLDGGERRPAA